MWNRFMILFNAADQDPINKDPNNLAPGYPWISGSTNNHEEANVMANALRVLPGFIGYAIFDRELNEVINEY